MVIDVMIITDPLHIVILYMLKTAIIAPGY